MSKIGTGTASAWARQGLRELRAALYPESNVAQSPELGVFGTAAPQEVVEGRRADAGLAEPPRSASGPSSSVLGQRLEAAQTRSQPTPEPERQLDRD